MAWYITTFGRVKSSPWLWFVLLEYNGRLWRDEIIGLFRRKRVLNGSETLMTTLYFKNHTGSGFCVPL